MNQRPQQRGKQPTSMLDLQALARTHTRQAIWTIKHVMASEDAPPGERLKAAGMLLDRGWGKPVQPVAGSVNENVTIVIRKVLEDIDYEDVTEVLPALSNGKSNGSA